MESAAKALELLQNQNTKVEAVTVELAVFDSLAIGDDGMRRVVVRDNADAHYCMMHALRLILSKLE